MEATISPKYQWTSAKVRGFTKQKIVVFSIKFIFSKQNVRCELDSQHLAQDGIKSQDLVDAERNIGIP